MQPLLQEDELHFNLGAQRQHVLRVHIQAAQARVCGQTSIVPQEPQLSSLQNGYHQESDGQLKPTMTDTLPAIVI